MTYQNPRTRATAPNPSSHINGHRACFAHAAAIDAHPKSRWALDDPDFSDRKPSDDVPLARDFVAWLERSGVEATR